MCEVNARNFKQLYPEIKRRLEESKFFSLDIEFSALDPLADQKASLFDTPAERYVKMRANLNTVIPLQVGLTAFTFDPRKNSYSGKVYTFYVQPACFQYVHRNFYFQTSTINFLRLYNFDFNKFIYDGIPYINRSQEATLREKMFSDGLSEINNACRAELEEITEKTSGLIRSWYEKAPLGESLSIPTICTKRNEETLYFVHKMLRSRFENLWTTVENGEFTIKKVSQKEYERLTSTYLLENETIENLLGFAKIFRLLAALKKPIVGHNCYHDLLLLISNFDTPLPEKYNQFKELVMQLFPVVFDTKSISYTIKRSVPEDKQWDDKSLNTLFDCFKNGVGRLLASNTPPIELEDSDSEYGKFHDAGWDSFCTGYIFVRLAHLNIYKKYPISKQFVTSELLGGLEMYKNRVNTIRASISHINLDKPDPPCTRPPYLLIESIKNQPVNVPQVASLLSTYGFIEVRKLPYQTRKALIAVDNFGNARRILSSFKNNPEYHICKYNALKHSPVIKGVLIGGLTVSSIAFLWITYTVVKQC